MACGYCATNRGEVGSAGTNSSGLQTASVLHSAYARHPGKKDCPCRALEYTSLLVSPEFDGLRVVLVAARNPLNIGAAARAMGNFGFSRLRVVNPYELAFREARSAVGASALLASAEEYKSVADAVADCRLVVGTTAVRHRELQHALRRLEYGGRLIRKQLGSSPVALLFGSEKFGLSNRDLSHCHWLIRIPTREQHLSMNLGQAVAVCLYELVRDARLAGVSEKPKLATAGESERITTLLCDLLGASVYMDPRRAASTEERVRRMVHRLKLSVRDAEGWLGILRQIEWTMHSKTNSPD
jgi:TrmH family RNA methyltransferase